MDVGYCYSCLPLNITEEGKYCLGHKIYVSTVKTSVKCFVFFYSFRVIIAYACVLRKGFSHVTTLDKKWF